MSAPAGMSGPVPGGHQPSPAGQEPPPQWAPMVVPGPPPGPGVTPPFPAPPTEGSSIRLWLGLGVAGLALLLCCGGGFAAMVALVVVGTEAIEEQAETAVRDYLTAVRDGRYDEAYDAMCPEARQRETRRQFAARLDSQPRIVGYELGQTQVTVGIYVPVEVRYANGESRSLRFELEQDTSTGELKVCRVEG